MTATNNIVNVPLSGHTGTGSFVGSTSPTLVTPTLGSATATSLAFSPTTGSIIGTTAADNASAGYVGEFVSSNISYASRATVTSSTGVQDLTSISLTKGDWDVWGNMQYFPAASTVVGQVTGWISTASATLPDPSVWFITITSHTTGVNWGIQCPILRLSIASTTTVYISGVAVWNTSTMQFCGGIYARRIR